MAVLCPEAPKRADGSLAHGQVAIIADDLTGALDTGAQFCKQGVETVVYLNDESLRRYREYSHRPDVVVVDTDSRWVTPDEAYRIVRGVCETLCHLGITRIYKKIDSTLRGNIGAEIDAVMDVLKVGLAYVVPAFPATQRKTIGGYQYLGDKPVEKTEVAEDIIAPVRESHVPSLLKSQTHREVGHIDLKVVEQGKQAVCNAIRDAVNRKVQILVLDASTQEHLKTIADAIADSGFAAVICGSAGLAAELPRVFGLIPRRLENTVVRHKPVVVVSGSRSQVTYEQLIYMSKNLPVKWLSLGLRGGTVPTPTDPPLEELERRAERVCSLAVNAVRAGESVIVSAVAAPYDEPSAVEQPLPAPNASHDSQKTDSRPSSIDPSQRVVRLLGRIARSILDSATVSGVVLTGGDTAAAVCRAVEASGIALMGEMLPGIPAGILIDGPFKGLTIVTKAGAFGDKTALARVMDFLQNMPLGTWAGRS